MSKKIKNLSIVLIMGLIFLVVFMFYNQAIIYAMADDTTQSDNVEFQFDYDLQNEYGLGETITLPKAYINQNGNVLDYYIVIMKDNNVDTVLDKNLSYTFDKIGDYSAIYCAKLSDGSITNSYFDFICKQKPYIITPDIPSSMNYFDTLLLNDGQLAVGEKLLKADLSIISPNKQQQQLVNNKFIPNQIGNYIFSYTATYENKTYQKDVFVKVDLQQNNLFTNVANIVEINKNFIYKTTNEDISGVEILGQGGSPTFAYKNMINLENLSKTDDLISFFALVDVGYEKFKGPIYISLTDAYDEDNVVTIKIVTARDNEYYSYISASFGGSFYGLSNESGEIHRDSYNSFGFVTNSGYTKHCDNPFRISYDYKTNQLLSNNGISWGTGSNVILDLDDPLQVGADTFKGFSQNKIYLSVSLPAFNGLGGVVVNSIANIDLGGSEFYDKTAPTILIEDIQNDSKYLPYAVKGEKYILPNAFAYDSVSGSSKVEIVVSLNDHPVTITDNAFIPSFIGEYVVCYSAMDAYKNESKKIFTLIVKDKLQDITASIKDVGNLYAGEYFNLPEIQLNGISGKAKIVKEVYLNDKIISKDEHYGYYLGETGKLKISLNVSDYLRKNAKVDITLQVVSKQKALVVINGVPEGIKIGEYFKPDEFYVTDFSINNQKDNTFKAMIINGKKADIKQGYLVSESDGEYLDVDFIGGRGVNESIIRKRIKVIQGDKLENYYITQGNPVIDISRLGSGFTSSTPFNVKLPFKILASKVHFSIIIDENNNNFNYFDIVFQDYYNEDIKFFIRISKFNDTHCKMQINGKDTQYIIDGSFINQDNSISLIYDDNDNKLYFESGTSITKIELDENGRIFDGFHSGFIKASIKVENPYGSSHIILNRMSNQVLNDFSLRLNQGPSIAVIGDMTNQMLGINEKFDVLPARCSDVLDFESSLSVRVIAPNGDILYDGLANKKLTFKGKQFGVYVIEYNAMDNSGNETSKKFNVVIEDRICPEIYVEGQLNISISPNTEYKIPLASIKDNNDSNPTLQCYIYSESDLHYTLVQMGEKYKFSKKGNYQIVYYGFDETFNVTHKTIFVKVG